MPKKSKKIRHDLKHQHVLVTNQAGVVCLFVWFGVVAEQVHRTVLSSGLVHTLIFRCEHNGVLTIFIKPNLI